MSERQRDVNLNYRFQWILITTNASIEGLSVIDGIEPEIPGEVIHLDQDRAFSAFRDLENSDSDYSDVKGGEDSSAI